MSEEMFDVLDENGVPTGQTVERKQAHIDGTWHRAVLIFVVNNKNKVLLQKRSMTKSKWSGRWCATAGGHVESGDIGLYAVMRELEEEIGISVRASDVRYIETHRSCNKGKGIDAHFNEYYVVHKNVRLKDVKIQESEVEEVKWLDYFDVRKMIEERSSKLTEKWTGFDAFVRYMDKYLNAKGEIKNGGR